MTDLLQNQDYKTWLVALKSSIQQRQIKAALSVNRQLIQMYWHLGEQIVEKQAQTQWGSGFIDQLSRDLSAAFPAMRGFSVANIKYCRQLYRFYNTDIVWQQVVAKLPKANSDAGGGLSQSADSVQSIENQFSIKSQQLVGFLENTLLNIPWGHHICIIDKIKNQSEAIFYIEQTIENNWSRSVLKYQIETNLYQRQGKSINNFKATMPEADSDLANAILKDTYNFDFLTLSSKVKETDLEQKLIEHITQFLLELGKGFAYLGRQFELNVGGEIFKIDLLFYHTKLKRYVIIEPKVTKFKPEHVGKLNFYVTAIDRLVKDAADKPAIGVLLCKDKNDVVVDFALHDIHKPLGVSEYSYKELSEDIQKNLPSSEAFQRALRKFDDENPV